MSAEAECRPQFFGEPWGVPALDNAVQVDIPVGEVCQSCGGWIAPGDRGWIRPYLAADEAGRPVACLRPIHAECELRSIVGHDFGICRRAGFESSRSSAWLVWDVAASMGAPWGKSPKG